MTELQDSDMLTIVKNLVEQHGCTLIDIDFDKQIINIDGPKEKQVECAMALEEVLGS